jgi:hypothetical protein
MRHSYPASVQEFRRHRAGDQGDVAPPPGPPTLFSVPAVEGRVNWEGGQQLPLQLDRKSLPWRAWSRRIEQITCMTKDYGCIGPSPWKRPSPAVASLRWPVDSASPPSVYLIETALQCETVAKNLQCRAHQLERLPMWQADSRRDVLGCSRLEKNGSTTSKNRPYQPIDC